MTIRLLNETLVGISTVQLLRKSDNRVIHCPPPSNFVFETGITQAQRDTRDSMGRLTTAFTFDTESRPTLSMTYSHVQPELLQFRLGRLFVERSAETKLGKAVTAYSSSLPGATSGYIGYGVVEDDIVQASIIRKHLSVELTQQDYATFDSSVQDSFAVGNNLALKFSTNLVNAEETISIQWEQTINGLSLGDELVKEHSILALMVTTEGEVVQFYAPRIEAVRDGGSFEPGGESLELQFRVLTLPGSEYACDPFNITYTGLKVSCSV